MDQEPDTESDKPSSDDSSSEAPADAVAKPRVWKNSLFNLVAFLWPLALMLVSTRYLLHRLGDARYGTWLVANAFLSLAGFTQFGMNDATTYFVSKHEGAGEPELAREAAAATLLLYCGVGLLAAVVLFALSPSLVHWFMRPEQAADATEALSLVKIVVWAFPLALVMGGVRATAAGVQLYWISMMAELLRATLWTGISVLAVWGNLGLTWLAVATVVAFVSSTTLGIGLLAGAGFRMPLLRLPRKVVIKRMLGYGGWIWFASVGAMSYGVLDRLLLGNLLGRAVVTYYAVPQGLGQRIHGLVQTVMHVVFPSIGAKGKDPAALAKFYAKSHTVVLLIVGALITGSALSGHAVLTLWVGAEFAERSAPIFRLILITVGLTGLGTLPYYTLLGTGRPRVVAIAVLVSGMLFLGAATFVARDHGVVGFAACSMLFGVYNVIHFFAVPDRATAKGTLVATMVAAACLGATLFVGLQLLAWLTPWHAIGAGFVAGTAAALMYLAMMTLALHRSEQLWPQLRLPWRRAASASTRG